MWTNLDKNVSSIMKLVLQHIMSWVCDKWEYPAQVATELKTFTWDEVRLRMFAEHHSAAPSGYDVD